MSTSNPLVVYAGDLLVALLCALFILLSGSDKDMP